LFNTKLPEATAEDVINHLDEGCSVRATARLVKVANAILQKQLCNWSFPGTLQA
jgi:hypothetical protein